MLGRTEGNASDLVQHSSAHIPISIRIYGTEYAGVPKMTVDFGRFAEHWLACRLDKWHKG
jgi:hypothetical protein